MKRIGAFSLAIFIFVLSVFSVVPVNVRADDDKTVIPLVEGHFGLTESDAQSKVSAHKDIYYDNNQRAITNSTKKTNARIKHVSAHRARPVCLPLK